MIGRLRPWILPCSVVALLFTGLTIVSGAPTPVTPRSIDRDLEPVIVTGADVPSLQGAPTDSLFVYAYQDDQWTQIPFQVDERVSGVYTSTLGSPLDAEDEIVFMASDLGDEPSNETLTATLPISPTWYRVEVTDPLTPTLKGWAYIVRSVSLTKAFTQTYASFDADAGVVTTAAYALGFSQTHPGVDYLALNSSGIDILDRTKIRIQTTLGTITEDSPYIPQPAMNLIKGGPVRVILRNGDVVAYHSLIETSTMQPLSFLGISAVRVSTDFNEQVSGSTYYNAATPQGVIIDGSPDEEVEPVPAGSGWWWQISHDSGTLVEVIDASETEGDKVSYYKDNDEIDSEDTGDQVSYADTGISIESPGPTVTYHSWLHVLAPDQPRVGSQYSRYATNPLRVTAVSPAEAHHKLYLPLVKRF